MIYHSGTDDFYGLESHCRQATRNLRPHLGEFDVIVTQGISGQCVGFIVAARLRKPIMVLRKGDEDRHGQRGTLVNQKACKGKRVLFLDDFISAGGTYRRCKQAVERAGGTLVGAYEYAPSGERYGKPVHKIPGRYRLGQALA